MCGTAGICEEDTLLKSLRRGEVGIAGLWKRVLQSMRARSQGSPLKVIGRRFLKNTKHYSHYLPTDLQKAAKSLF